MAFCSMHFRMFTSAWIRNGKGRHVLSMTWLAGVPNHRTNVGNSKSQYIMQCSETCIMLRNQMKTDPLTCRHWASTMAHKARFCTQSLIRQHGIRRVPCTENLTQLCIFSKLVGHPHPNRQHSQRVCAWSNGPNATPNESSLQAFWTLKIRL